MKRHSEVYLVPQQRLVVRREKIHSSQLTFADTENVTWVQKSTLGPWYSQKWQRAIMAFMLGECCVRRVEILSCLLPALIVTWWWRRCSSSHRSGPVSSAQHEPAIMPFGGQLQFPWVTSCKTCDPICHVVSSFYEPAFEANATGIPELPRSASRHHPW